MRSIATVLAGIGLCLATTQPASAVNFQFTRISGDTLTADQSAAFSAAAAAWSSRLSDPITVNISIGFRSLGGNILGGATPTGGMINANVVKSLLAADITSADDAAAVMSLPVYSATAQLTLTNAEAHAIGAAFTTTGSDGTIGPLVDDGMIEFNSDYVFSTSRDSGGNIAAGTFDLIGIAEHEIEHILGFDSSLDFGGTATVLDQFRYASPGVRSTVPGTNAYFSLNNGLTDIADFSVGGSGNAQASHWLSGTTSDGKLALMNPTIAPGQVENITSLDLRAADVIGYNVGPVPEPASWMMMIGGFGTIGFRLRRRKQRTGASSAEWHPSCVGPRTDRPTANLSFSM